MCGYQWAATRKGHTGLITKKNDTAAIPENEQNVEPGAQETEAQASAVKGAEASQTGGETSEDEKSAQGKEISETDILKAYVEQAIAEIKRLRAEMGAKKKEADDSKAEAIQIKGKLDSVISEYENFRRRTAQEKEALLTEAVVKSVATLLPALDSLERAVQFSTTNPDSYRQGVEMTLKQLGDGFKTLGVTEIEAQGVGFDPERHNAVMHIEDKTISDSIVTEVFQKGYAIGDRVIRHSAVKVAN